MEKGEQSPEEYILALEKQLRALQADNRQLGALRSRVTEMEKQQSRMQSALGELTESKKLLCEQMTEAEIRHEHSKAEMRAEYEDRMYREIVQHETEMSMLRRECEARMLKNNERYDEKILMLENGFGTDRNAYEQRLLDQEARYEEKIRELEARLSDSEESLASVSRECDRLSEQSLVYEARIKALRRENGEVFDETAFTSEEDFNADILRKKDITPSGSARSASTLISL